MGIVEIELTKGYQCLFHGKESSMKIKAERADIDEKLQHFINNIRWWY